jgi:hypothetical protein
MKLRAIQIIETVLCVLALSCGTAHAGKRCEKIVEAFVLENVDILRDYVDPSERQERYKRALKRLIRDARTIYGPFCPCDEFLKKATALQKQREAWRSPPPGWDPRKFSDSYRPLEIELARKDVQLLMDLMSLCDNR